MFRCPTCIGVLPDPTTRRCSMCGQGLRRRRPRVLGEENRPGARMLPIERALHERLHGAAPRGRGTRRYAPPPWAEQYRANALHATVRIQREAEVGGHGNNRSSGGVGTLVAPAPFDFEHYAAPPAPTFEEPLPLDVQSYLSSFELHTDDVAVDETVDMSAAAPASALLDDTAVVAPPPVDVAPPAPVVAEPEPVFEVEPGPLDPEVQALVDDLYRKARAEIVGSFDGMESELVPEPVAHEETTTEAPPVDAPRRRGWVPAVLADRRRHDGTGQGKRPNGNGWRRLD